MATDAGRYVQLIAEGREEEAYLVARAPNPFASVCGRVCAAPCEDACRRGAIDGRAGGWGPSARAPGPTTVGATSTGVVGFLVEAAEPGRRPAR